MLSLIFLIEAAYIFPRRISHLCFRHKNDFQFLLRSIIKYTQFISLLNIHHQYNIVYLLCWIRPRNQVLYIYQILSKTNHFNVTFEHLCYHNVSFTLIYGRYSHFQKFLYQLSRGYLHYHTIDQLFLTSLTMHQIAVYLLIRFMLAT